VVLGVDDYLDFICSICVGVRQSDVSSILRVLLACDYSDVECVNIDLTMTLIQRLLLAESGRSPYLS
jgi:hypothetical protein